MALPRSRQPPRTGECATHDLEADFTVPSTGRCHRSVRVIILTGAGRALPATPRPDRGPGAAFRPDGQVHAEFIEYWQRNDAGRSPIGPTCGSWENRSSPRSTAGRWAAAWYQLAADITIASDQAVFAQPEVRHISNSSFLFGALCGWKTANRWALTGDHFDAQEARHRHGQRGGAARLAHGCGAGARQAHRAGAEPSVRLNKSVTMLGLQDAGVYSGLLLEGALGALAPSSHNEFREQLFEAQRQRRAQGISRDARRPVPARAYGVRAPPRGVRRRRRRRSRRPEIRRWRECFAAGSFTDSGRAGHVRELRSELIAQPPDHAAIQRLGADRGPGSNSTNCRALRRLRRAVARRRRRCP